MTEIKEHIEKYVMQYINEIKNHGINYSESLAKKYLPWIYNQHQIKAVYKVDNRHCCDIDIYLIASKKYANEFISREKISDAEIQNLESAAEKILPIYGITFEHMTPRYAGVRASNVVNKIFSSI